MASKTFNSNDEIPREAFGTSSAEFGEVSEKGEVIKTPQEISRVHFGSRSSRELPRSEIPKTKPVFIPETSKPPVPVKKKDPVPIPKESKLKLFKQDGVVVGVEDPLAQESYAIDPSREEDIRELEQERFEGAFSFVPTVEKKEVFKVGPPEKAWGTSSAEFGEVSEKGKILKYPVQFNHELPSAETLGKSFDYEKYISEQTRKASRIVEAIESKEFKINIANLGEISALSASLEREAYKSRIEGTTPTKRELELRKSLAVERLGEEVGKFEAKETALNLGTLLVVAPALTVGVGLGFSAFGIKATSLIYKGVMVFSLAKFERSIEDLKKSKDFSEMLSRTGQLSATVGGAVLGVGILKSPGISSFSKSVNLKLSTLTSKIKTPSAFVKVSKVVKAPVEFAKGKYKIWDYKMGVRRTDIYFKKHPFPTEKTPTFQRFQLVKGKAGLKLIDQLAIPGQKTLRGGVVKLVKPSPKVDLRNIDLSGKQFELIDYGKRIIYSPVSKKLVFGVGQDPKGSVVFETKAIVTRSPFETFKFQDRTSRLSLGEKVILDHPKIRVTFLNKDFSIQTPLQTFDKTLRVSTPKIKVVRITDKPFEWMRPKPPEITTIAKGETGSSVLALSRPKVDVTKQVSYKSPAFETSEVLEGAFPIAGQGFREDSELEEAFTFGEILSAKLGEGLGYKAGLDISSRVRIKGLTREKAEVKEKVKQIPALRVIRSSRFRNIITQKVIPKISAVPALKSPQISRPITALVREPFRIPPRPPPLRDPFIDKPRPEPIGSLLPRLRLNGTRTRSLSLDLKPPKPSKKKSILVKADWLSLTISDARLGRPATHLKTTPKTLALFLKKRRPISFRFPTKEQFKGVKI